jgi:exoribonuclease R
VRARQPRAAATRSSAPIGRTSAASASSSRRPDAHEDLYIAEQTTAGASPATSSARQSPTRPGATASRCTAGRSSRSSSAPTSAFVGSLAKQHGDWLVFPDGNTLTEPILTPDAAARHIKPGTKVVVELTQYPADGQRAAGVITDVLGQPGEKDVDLKSVIVQFNLPETFPDEVKRRPARRSFVRPEERSSRAVSISPTG